ncbi:MAG: DUF4124 domain-containing protein [Ketobacter sp.]|nr:DUF4124 domain-containing protein [Ketobacter sp.]
MTRTFAIFSILALFSLQATAATVYKYTDESGNLVFTDEPTEGAEKMDVKPVATIPAIPVPAADTSDTTTPTEFKYDKVTIITPSNDEHFINNGGQVSVQVALSPALRKNDKLQLKFNGTNHGKLQRSPSFKLDNLDRGEYATQVVVVDNKGKEIGSSETVTFYVKRSAAGPKKSPK